MLTPPSTSLVRKPLTTPLSISLGLVVFTDRFSSYFRSRIGAERKQKQRTPKIGRNRS